MRGGGEGGGVRGICGGLREEGRGSRDEVWRRRSEEAGVRVEG